MGGKQLHSHCGSRPVVAVSNAAAVFTRPRINQRNVGSAVGVNLLLLVYILLEVLCDGPFASFPSARWQGSRVWLDLSAAYPYPCAFQYPVAFAAFPLVLLDNSALHSWSPAKLAGVAVYEPLLRYFLEALDRGQTLFVFSRSGVHVRCSRSSLPVAGAVTRSWAALFFFWERGLGQNL